MRVWRLGPVSLVARGGGAVAMLAGRASHGEGTASDTSEAAAMPQVRAGSRGSGTHRATRTHQAKREEEP